MKQKIIIGVLLLILVFNVFGLVYYEPMSEAEFGKLNEKVDGSQITKGVQSISKNSKRNFTPFYDKR